MDNKEEIYARLKQALIELFDIEPSKISAEARLNDDLGIDSIDAIDLLLKLKDMTGRKIQPEAFKNVRSVGDVVEAIHALGIGAASAGQ
ncbi:MAG: acyl carrier protein [Nevskia sp.]|nr:acyl carrier protein [Nevskia sp.]